MWHSSETGQIPELHKKKIFVGIYHIFQPWRRKSMSHVATRVKVTGDKITNLEFLVSGLHRPLQKISYATSY